ncbi:MAG TPA: hypothetical protein VIH42_05255 [Thermoguttaceae bacterium]
MDDELKSALKKAILASLSIVRGQLQNFSEVYLFWRKRSAGHWHGECQHRPALQKVFNATRNQLDEIAADCTGLFMAKHPEYSGPVGLAGLNQHRILTFVTWIPESAIRWLWYTHGSLDVDDALLDVIINELEESVELPTVRLRFQAQLLNYRMAADRLILPDDLVIRRLSEQEVSVLDGGPLITLGFMRPRFAGPHEFVIEGEVEVEKQHRNFESFVNNIARDRFNKTILCLRTFKSGHVGYDYIHFRPVKFCQFAMGSRGCGDSYVPFGGYHISKEEEESLHDYAAMFFHVTEPAMEMAFSRLADAETRTRPQDRLLDAVIGMEAILLAGSKKQKQIKRNLSRRYSTLFDSTKERDLSCKVAKDLYKLRCDIAHGNEMKSNRHLVGHEQLTLADAASRATEALRMIIRRFLPEANVAPYRKSTFWDRAYFGLGKDADD